MDPTPEEEELSRKVAELERLDETLAAREAELARLEVELHVFEVQYLETVGRRYAELDAAEAAVAEREARREPENLELLERAEEARARAEDSAEALDVSRSRHEPPPGPVSEDLRRLFRKVARVIHPDLAEDDAARARRQELMGAANRAYLTGDETRLASILAEWEESPEAVPGHGTAAELLRAIRQIARVRARTETVERETAALNESELFALRDRVERAEAEGRDLLAEMAAALLPRLEAAAARLQVLTAEGAP